MRPFPLSNYRSIGLGLSLVVSASACGGNPQTAAPGDDVSLGGTGAAGSGGTGDVVLPGGSGGTSGDGGTGGTTPVDPCGNAAPCHAGQRCEVVNDAAECVDNTCDDLTCSPTEECQSYADGGYVCVDIGCTEDVQCPVEQYCDGTICVDDICTAESRECDGDRVLECTSNGGEIAARFECGSDAYFESVCVEPGTGEAHCGCEDDWDCPPHMACEIDRCVGTGVEPTCTLDPVDFTDIPPSVEVHWGGESRANDDAHDGTPAQSPAPWPSYSHVMNTPVVANLDDDNGDGLINELDFPEILFVAHARGNNDAFGNGVLRAIHGGGPKKGADYFARCADELWTSTAPTSTACEGFDPDADAGAPVAVGDLNDDGIPEIVVPTEGNVFRILDNRGRQLFQLSEPWAPSPGGETLAIANLDHTGFAEIIMGRNVYLLGDDGAGGIEVTAWFVGEAAEGTNSGMGIMACPADVIPSLPGQEIAVGATLYRLPDDLTCNTPPCALEVVWDAPTAFPGQDEKLTGEGYCAIADVWGADDQNPPGPDNPLDGTPEIVLIDDGHLTILAADTGKIILDRDLGGQRGGAPNVDDFDGDGFMEVASALQDFYMVVELQPSTGAAGSCPDWPEVIPRAVSEANPNPARTPGGACTSDAECDPAAVCNTQVGRCVCLHNEWRRDSDDDSSRATSSSVFDFNGDGAAEVIYNDECNFRIYDGVSGGVLFSEISRSRTAIENPVVADVDNDGNAEVVVGMNTAQRDRCDDDPGDPAGPNGIRIWGDPTDTWVSARRIWNQQSYHVTNVTEAGRIPKHPPESWGAFGGRTYNTYRSQPRNFGVAPDLTVVAVNVSSPDAGCGVLSDNIDITFEVRNVGDLRVGPGVVVDFHGTWGGTDEVLLDPQGDPLVHVLQANLEPGVSIYGSVNFHQANNGRSSLPDSVRVMVDATSAERECVEDNNERSENVDAGDPEADLRIELGVATADCPDARVETTLFNDGTADATDVKVRYFAGDPTQGGSAIHEEIVAGPLVAGGNLTFTAVIPNFPVDRDIVVYGIVDPDNEIPECNDGNNMDAADDSIHCGTIPL